MSTTPYLELQRRESGDPALSPAQQPQGGAGLACVLSPAGSSLGGAEERGCLGVRVLHLGDEEGGLRPALLVEGEHVREGVLAGHVTVEHEEGLAGTVVEVLPREGQGAGGAHGLHLLGSNDLDVELLGPRFQERHHPLGLIVDGEDYLIDTGIPESLNLVDDDGLVGEVHDGLGDGEGEGAEASAEAAHEDESLEAHGDAAGLCRAEVVM
mmetsp:Transcript_26151/g.83520  ORF Transcript_26151/g.83520 Transcript_26151/m.83520 type:complete len:211 (+) Transcript_26151:2673-3305(+)